MYVVEKVTETRVLGTCSTTNEEWVEGKLNKTFLHFFLADSGYPKIGFWVTVLPLVVCI